MSPAVSRRMEADSAAVIVAEIKTLFEQYGSTFAALAAGTRSDLEALLQFYSAPFRYVGADFHLVLKDSSDIVGPGGIGGEVSRLRHAGYQGSTLEKCDVNVLNARAALVTATWRREEQRGSPVSFRVVYFLALTAEGWRITTAANAPD